MKRIKTRFYRAAALLVAAVLIAGLAMPVQAAESGTIYINTVSDLREFSHKCSLDTWSQGKTVVLQKDISLEGEEFDPIPIFCGTFDGNGHTISGLDLTDAVYPAGLFGIIQQDGVVKNLTVTGTVAPDGDADTLGGIAGLNRGQLTSCTFRGMVDGKVTAGGIVGKNEATGQLINCSFFGSVTGEHYVGGIAGQNLGSIVRCVNSGSINTTQIEIEETLSSLEGLNNLRDPENLPTGTDIGGVAGYSSGILQSCTNRGAVGYDHMGYNVGGIVGRQSGYLDGCVNTGSVKGRKDVGGIAGQMEPQVTLKYSEDTLNNLWDELEELEVLVNQTVDHVEGISDDVSLDMDALSDSVKEAKNSTSDLADAMSDWANENLEQIDDASARLSWIMDQMEPILDDLSDSMEELADAADDLSDSMDVLYYAGDPLGEGAEELNQAMKEFKQALKDAKDSVRSIRQAMDDLKTGLGDREKVTAALSDFATGLKNLQKALADIGDISKAVGHMQAVTGDMQEFIELAQPSLDLIAEACDHMGDAIVHLNDSVEGIEDVCSDQSELPPIQFQPIGSDITDKGDDLDDALGTVLDQVNVLKDTMDASSDVLPSDIKAISEQMGAVIDALRSGLEDTKDGMDQDHFEDVSEEAVDDSAARVTSSRNTGAVAGDINAAGIVGSLAIEYDFDPEDDITESGDRSLDFRYQAAAVIRDSSNEGTVTAKRDYAGGVVGRMDLGSVSRCGGYGDVSSKDGDYVGGIVGLTRASVRECFAKCTLSGDRYVGGIAGAVSEDGSVTGCYTMVEIPDAGSYTGAISGDDVGSFQENFFVSDELAGLGRVSYAGLAEPMDYETFLTVEGLPDVFRRFTLHFIAGDKELKTDTFQYGASFRDEDYPDIPAKEGEYGQWDHSSLKNLHFETVVEAVYTPYLTTIESDGKRENGRPIFYANGQFREGDQVEAQMISEEQSGFGPGSFGRWYSRIRAEEWKVSIPSDGQETHLLRFLPASEEVEIWINGSDGWSQAETTAVGRYLTFEVEGDQVELVACQRVLNHWVWTALGVIVVLVAAVGIMQIVKRRNQKRKERVQKQ